MRGRPLKLALATMVLSGLWLGCGATDAVEAGRPDGDDVADSGAGDLVDDGRDAPTDRSEPDPDATDAPDTAGAADAPGSAGDPDVGDGPAGDTGALTGSGTWADPFVVTSFPFEHSSDTATSSTDVVDAYSCAPDTDESGPEVVYRLSAPMNGIASVVVDDSTSGVDVDVHLLGAAGGESCRQRHNTQLWDVVLEGETIWVSVDTWVNSGGTELPGPYRVTIDLEPLPGGDCAVSIGDIDLINRDEPLVMPAIGQVVMEAHLVTTEEFSGTWPTSSRDGIPAHYALTQTASGYVMERDEPWAPEGEGGSQWGQGSTARPPPLDETWYVNMYWTRSDRPARGTPMLIYNPDNGRAAIAAAGYETGPGSALRIGGVTEEIHHALGSSHRTRLLLGFVVDQTVDFGPIDCD